MRSRESNPSVSPTRLFVLGTGRCGTKTLAHVLGEIDGCTVVHELAPMLLHEVSDYLAGTMSQTQVADLVRQTRQARNIGGTRLCGESNQRLSFILPVLHEVYPEARYLWLIRDGRSAVASMAHRYWYHPREAALRESYHAPSAATRIQADVVGDMSSDAWTRLDPFARCCWYWSYTNRHIADQSRQLGLMMMKVRLEDLSGQILPIMQFLSLDDLAAPQMKRSNAAHDGRPLPWKSWSDAQLDGFTRLAGAEMDKHYPQWRQDLARRDGNGLSSAVERGAYRVKQFGYGIKRRIKDQRRRPAEQ